ncbi:MAG: hypothetical protein L0H73_08265 [Nitrococcus sp.]|nr:hypothetical protein [Nitrococcus sp.]
MTVELDHANNAWFGHGNLVRIIRATAQADQHNMPAFGLRAQFIDSGTALHQQLLGPR